MLGDNIYGGHGPSDYHKKFELPYKGLLDAGVQFYGQWATTTAPPSGFTNLST